MTTNETPAAKCNDCGKEPRETRSPAGAIPSSYYCLTSSCIGLMIWAMFLEDWNKFQAANAARDKELERVAFEAGWWAGERMESLDVAFDDWQREREGK